MKRFWISWYTATDESPETSWKWWVSGEVCSTPTLWTICAVIDAEDEAGAKAIALKAFPDAALLPLNWTMGGKREGWRFCEEHPLDWTPAADRFPGFKEPTYESVAQEHGLRVEEVVEQLARENQAAKQIADRLGLCPLPPRTQEPGQGSQA